ncbi:MAG: oligosaccharide flippase family protein [Chloroflexota bacterium]
MSVAARLREQRQRLIPPGSVRSRMAGGAAWSLASAVAMQGAMMVASVLMARILGVERYGQVALINVTVGMLGVFAGLGLSLTATKTVAELRSVDPPRLARALVLLDRCVITSVSAAAALMVVLAPVIATAVLGAPEMVELLRLGAVLLLLNEFAGVQTGMLAGFEAFRAVARIALVRATVTVAACAGGALVAGSVGAVVGLILAAGAAVLLGRLTLRRLRIREGVDRPEGRLMAEFPILWRFTLPAFISIVFVGPVAWIGSLLLASQPGGFAELGVFNAAAQWRTPVLLFPNVISQTALPIMASLAATGEIGRLRRVLVGSIAASTAIAASIGGVLILLQGFVMGLYGEGFADSGDVLAVVAVTGIVVAVGIPIGPLLAAVGRMWLGALTNVAGAIVFVGTAVVLISGGGGAMGLAMAYLLAWIANGAWALVAAWFVLRRRGRAEPA